MGSIGLGVSLPEDGNTAGFRNFLFLFFYFRRWTKSKHRRLYHWILLYLGRAEASYSVFLCIYYLLHLPEHLFLSSSFICHSWNVCNLYDSSVNYNIYCKILCKWVTLRNMKNNMSILFVLANVHRLREMQFWTVNLHELVCRKILKWDILVCLHIEKTEKQWRTQEFRSVGGGSTNSVEDRGQRTETWGAVAPYPLVKGSVKGSWGSCNLVQEISFHIVKVS